MKYPLKTSEAVGFWDANYDALYFVADVNECSFLTHCPSGQRCVNYPGTSRCYCSSPGQVLTDDGDQCLGEQKDLLIALGLILVE